MESILLTIIIPIYNAEKYLKECLNSIIKCQKNKIEIILIDDGSKDNSYNICREYKNIDKRFVLLHQRNSGVSKARNNGLNIAKGKYICFVDADDLLDKNWGEIINYITNADIYYFSDRLKKDVKKEEMIKYIVGYNNENICFAGPFSKIIKKELLDAHNIRFNEELINGEDMLFNLKCISVCNNFKVIPQSFYKYRNFIGSATKKFDKYIFESDLLFQKEIKKLKIDNNLKKNIEIYNTQMAIYVLLQRISYIKKYKFTKEYYSFINDIPYSSSLSCKFLINKKYRVVLFLAKIKQFLLIYLIFRFIRYMKTNKNGFYFSKI